jgi:hypothetical protein
VKKSACIRLIRDQIVLREGSVCGTFSFTFSERHLPVGKFEKVHDEEQQPMPARHRRLCLLLILANILMLRASSQEMTSEEQSKIQAQRAEAATIINDLANEATRASEMVEANHRDEALQVVDKITKQLGWLRRWWQPNCPDPDGYSSFGSCVQATMASYNRALQVDLVYLRSKTAGRKSDEIFDALKEVEQDTRAKSDHCKATHGGIGDTVNLTIRTKINDAEVGGWQIFYRLKCDEAGGDPETFPKISSPTKKALPPGRYFVWAKKGGKVSDKTPVTIGSNGDLDWDIPVN